MDEMKMKLENAEELKADGNEFDKLV